MPNPDHSDRPAPHAWLAEAIAGSALPKYVYGYPPKRAFRPMVPARTIEEAWRGAEGPLNLYLHIPFCGYRCSFCTLFLTTAHTPAMVQDYVDAVVRQVATYGALIGHMQVVSLYLGGGTPTVLQPEQLATIFGALRRAFPDWSHDAEIGIEGSPDTMRPELLAAARGLGVNRVSMGLQSLDPEEQARVGRRYSPQTVYDAVEAITAQNFANVNYDLIYGLEGQTEQTWQHSLQTTESFGPQTITLYPVVVRPLTSLSKRVSLQQERFMDNATKYAIYDLSVAWLADRGFSQNSFVRFSRCAGDGLQQEAADFSGVPLLGLGAGSRSYTRGFHYSSDFAVGRRESLEIIEDFIAQTHGPTTPVGIGFDLTRDEAQRRFCVLNLSLGAIDAARYRERFGTEVEADFGPELSALVEQGCCDRVQGAYRLTPRGFKYSNVIGDLFQSAEVTALEAEFVPR